MGFEGLKGRWWGDEDYFFCVCPHACCACEGKECDEDLSSHRMNRGRIDTTACCESAAVAPSRRGLRTAGRGRAGCCLFQTRIAKICCASARLVLRPQRDRQFDPFCGYLQCCREGTPRESRTSSQEVNTPNLSIGERTRASRTRRVRCVFTCLKGNFRFCSLS